jgi:hypothetical protein
MIVSDVAPPHKETVMSQAISTQHPAVVLRSRYQQLRALLAVAMIAVVGLTAAVVILAIQNDGNTIVRAASPANAPSASAIRSDGGPEESALAATLGPQQTLSGADESRIAAAVGSAEFRSTAASGPDESTVASAISGR